MVSFPLSSKAESAGQMVGRITGVTANTISNSAAGWTAGQLSQAATPKLIRITSGAAQGHTFLVSTSTQNTATTLTIDGEDAALVNLANLGIVTGASGDTYEILEADTLRSVFGTPSDGVQGGTTSATADVVTMMVLNAWRKYYFNTNTGKWMRVGAETEADNIVIRPDTVVLYSRLPASNLVLTALGEVPSRQRKALVKGNATTPYASFWPQARTLANSGIHQMPGWVRSTDVNIADQVMLMVGGVWRKYYHNNTEWLRVGADTAANTIELPVGSGALIIKKSSAATTTEPPPYTL